MTNDTTSLVPPERIERCILLVRGHKVMLDAELADLYEVPTKALVQAVKRNPDRFPDDFAFPLTDQEFAILRSQSVTSRSWGGRRYLPYVFTEQGVAMLSSVLNSKRAAQVNVQIMRTFVKLRMVLASHEDLRRKVLQLEGKYDSQFKVVFDAIRQIIEKPTKETPRIGFTK
jgi:hypothetical protein